MSKKHDKEKDKGKGAKIVVGDRWTVRGVGPTLQKAAGAAARAQGLTVGQWLCKAIETAIADGPHPVPAEDWRSKVEYRLQQLEMALLSAEAPPAAIPAVAPILLADAPEPAPAALISPPVAAPPVAAAPAKKGKVKAEPEAPAAFA